MNKNALFILSALALATQKFPIEGSGGFVKDYMPKKVKDKKKKRRKIAKKSKRINRKRR